MRNPREDSDSLQDVLRRIEQSKNGFISIGAMLNDPLFAMEKIMDEKIKNGVKKQAATYESIRDDFLRIIGNENTEITDLLPKVEVDMETGLSIATSLIEMLNQLRKMKLYCERKLSCKLGLANWSLFHVYQSLEDTLDRPDKIKDLLASLLVVFY